ncbi:MAG: PQQ-binding-like beta-propeller repeat protein [Chloroflexi bacterium]|nr:PQQ-binding-like beta-propeller repeat protein [Chloroflexota bacterium]MCI0577584.1 PQQ-binding-like beta-propeller repeat protein [Chloroflexota bacterium]MCI0644196.1 PQQ-binding-like beta-propeller repeat protein [Chloroflexota bacterium]MCI0725221.1 PQQ-binding-like beta-propeller repeat protein [Chloroflexota bacterium]
MTTQVKQYDKPLPRRRTRIRAALVPLLAAVCLGLLTGRILATGGGAGSWPMFHRDALHSGVAPGAGNINPNSGPIVRWTYQVTAPPADFSTYRWYASFPIADLDGDGTQEVVVTTPDNSGEADRVIALQDRPGQVPPVEAMWVYTATATAGQWGVDQYSAALADADGDTLPDVLFTSKDGYVRALKGSTGQLIWEYQSNRFIEAGPMVADLEGDGLQEVIVVTDCQLGVGCPGSTNGGSLLVFAAQASGVNPPLWSYDYPYKLDSAEPAIADLDPGDGQARLAIIMGSWGAQLLVAWRQPNHTIISHGFDIRTLDPTVPADAPSVIRSSPLVANFGSGPTAVFGWMPDWTIGTEARISAVGLNADMAAGTVQFTPGWTESRDDWKSSVALLPVANPPLVVTGYGIGTTQGTANYGLCDPVSGGIIALEGDGDIAWEHNFGDTEGNVRGSVAVADVDGDGQLEVLLTTGCYGKIHAYDGATGAEEWSFQLGPRTIASPAVADLDGDGSLEIIAASYDGQVWALSGGARLYLPLVRR